MRQTRYQLQETQFAGQRPPTAEDLNRAAAVERACCRQGVEWIEDRRSQPRRVWTLPEPLH